MRENYLKLTAYFGERQRAGSQFLAEAMLDLFAERQVAASVMLRGIASFGPHNIIRSDESLTLSEDPPAAITAVDTESVIGGIVGDAVAMTTRGLLTVERARLLDGDLAGAPLPRGTEEVKLTCYVGRRRTVGGRPAFHTVCDLLQRNDFAGATVFLGVDGTVHGRRRRARFFSRNVDVPVMILAVGGAEQAGAVLSDLHDALHRPLVLIERVRVCKIDGRLLGRPPELPAADAAGRPLWQKLMVHTSEAARHDGTPIHRALVRRLRESRTASGATVLRGIWGFQGDQKPQGDKLIQLGRQVPVTTIVIDSPERIALVFEIVDELTAGHGLVTCEMVPARLLADGGPAPRALDLADYRY